MRFMLSTYRCHGFHTYLFYRWWPERKCQYCSRFLYHTHKNTFIKGYAGSFVTYTCLLLAQRKAEEAFKEFEADRKPSCSTLDGWQVRQELKQIRCHGNPSNDKFTLVYCNLQVRNEIKLLCNGDILFALHYHESPSSGTALLLKGS